MRNKWWLVRGFPAKAGWKNSANVTVYGHFSFIGFTPARGKTVRPARIINMNFLAHAFLSFEEPELLVGNLLADFVRGKQQNLFSPAIQAGIRLHRAIDRFTDYHEEVRRAKGYLTPACGRYSGVFTDVVFDHFLARDDRYFTGKDLRAFSRRTYVTLEAHQAIFPEKFRRVFQLMKAHDWLSGYRDPAAIARSFAGLYHRATFLPESGDAMIAFEQHYEQMRRCYFTFMPEAIRFAHHSIDR
jgi:acyl carrier protein phosphodiesterase